jgi:hypothetical protein
MHRYVPIGENFANEENISGTLPRTIDREKPSVSGPEGCVFIAADSWPAGYPPFCGAPVLTGSPYCPAHAQLCRADTEIAVTSGGRL